MTDETKIKTDKRVDRAAEALHGFWARWAAHMFGSWTLDNRRWWRKKMGMDYSDLKLTDKTWYRYEAQRLLAEIDGEN